jgi:peptide/nickel transport system permease protein
VKWRATTDGPHSRKRGRLSRWESPWLNRKFVAGGFLLLLVFLVQFVGPKLWDTKLARVASSPLNLPPMWAKGDPGLGFGEPDPAHPLGTESNGRDIGP